MTKPNHYSEPASDTLAHYYVWQEIPETSIVSEVSKMPGVSNVSADFFVRIWWLLVASVICILMMMSTPIRAYAGTSGQETKDILYLSSYGYSWDGVPYQIKGFSDVVNKDIATVEYVTLNNKIIPYYIAKPTAIEQIQEFQNSKGQFDLVVTVDDAALDFVLEERETLFSGVPVVFMGVNTKERAMEAHEDPLITGMIESFPYNETISLAHAMYPKATKIVGISDDTPSGQGCSTRFLNEAKNFTSLEFSILYTSIHTQDEIAEQLSSYGDDTILCFLAMINDKDGNSYTAHASSEFVEKHASIPVFKADLIGIGDGIFGGYVSSPENMGRAAGEQAIEILNGKSPAYIQVNTMSGYPMFDQNLLDKFHVKREMLPADAVIINKHASTWDTYRDQIIFSTFSVILLCLLATFYLIHRQHRLNRHLVVALEKAEEARKEKSEFLARMSHDMRTPMNTIINLTDMLGNELDDKKTALKDIENIKISNDFLLSLIKDLLDTSRIESGKLVLRPERYKYETFLEYMHLNFDRLAEKHNIRLDIVEGTENADIMIDKARFNQICFNLVSNAIKYTEPGGHVSFSMHHGEIKDGILPCDIIVSDDGIGMTDEFQKGLFTAFKQEGRGYRTIEGAGLGLSIVKSIVDAMNGTIRIESKADEGTTVYVHLDMKLAGPEEEAADTVINYDLEGKHVLLAEDHVMNQEIARRLLEKVGIKVDIVDNGEKCLEQMKNETVHYDAILMDLRMPVMDGLEATRRIRMLDSEYASSIPIIAMTANAMESDKIDCENAGMNDHVAKPVNPKLLYRALAKVWS